MCGIIGYIGKRQAENLLVEGLKRLEYRGYDSAGVAVYDGKKLHMAKCKGRIRDLENILQSRRLSGTVGIGHTRWATHGRPSTANAHPHLDNQEVIAVVHNGIIENYSQIRHALQKEGYVFHSETDTEVVAHLVKKYYHGNLKNALAAAVKKLKGSYALALVSSLAPDEIAVARKDSPLVIGLGKGENFVASDVSALAGRTKKVIYLHDGDMAVVKADKIEIFDAAGNKARRKVDTVSYSSKHVQKGGFKHYMLKEIHEQPEVLKQMFSCYAGSGRIKFDGLTISPEVVKRTENVVIVACGTAYHAGMVAKYAIEQFTRVPVWVDLASEFRYRNPIIKKNTLVIAISQSGETADTLAAVRLALKQGSKVLAVCNVVGSTLVREADSVIYTLAGPEISVASTKAYTAQVMVLYLLALYLAGLKKTLPVATLRQLLKELKTIPAKQREIFRDSNKIRAIARRHLHFGAFLYLGRNFNFPTALEGALKLKEISYIPAEGYAAGEMKHGPIALIDEYRAVVCVANDTAVFDKMVSNIQEILARRGKVIVVASQADERIKEYSSEILPIPKIDDMVSPLLTVVPLQLFAYHMADLKGYDVDKPRNLAKSVTVE